MDAASELQGAFSQILAKLEAIEKRLDRLEQGQAARAHVPSPNGPLGGGADLNELLALAPHIIATATDAIDAEVASAARRGQDVDRALRNGLQAALYFGERISPAQLDALGKLLDSDILSPGAIDAVERAGRALAAASAEPRGSAGMFTLMTGAGNPDVKRSLAFLLQFARQFGAALKADRAAETGAVGERSGR